MCSSSKIREPCRPGRRLVRAGRGGQAAWASLSTNRGNAPTVCTSFLFATAEEMPIQAAGGTSCFGSGSPGEPARQFAPRRWRNLPLRGRSTILPPKAAVNGEGFPSACRKSWGPIRNEPRTRPCPPAPPPGSKAATESVPTSANGTRAAERRRSDRRRRQCMSHGGIPAFSAVCECSQNFPPIRPGPRPGDPCRPASPPVVGKRGPPFPAGARPVSSGAKTCLVMPPDRAAMSGPAHTAAPDRSCVFGIDHSSSNVRPRRESEIRLGRPGLLPAGGQVNNLSLLRAGPPLSWRAFRENNPPRSGGPPESYGRSWDELSRRTASSGPFLDIARKSRSAGENASCAADGGDDRGPKGFARIEPINTSVESRHPAHRLQSPSPSVH